MKNILIVDNDAGILDVMHEALSYEGFDVTVVTETRDIHQLIRNADPNLVILDFLLGEINGGELCHQVKSNPATAHIPVILFSAYPKVMMSLGDYGCDAFLPKPFDLETLINQVNELVLPEATY